MTTIAWDGRTLAADTMACDNRNEGYATKAFRIGGALVAGSGHLAIVQRFFGWVRGGMIGYPPPMRMPDDDSSTCIIITTAGNVLAFYDGGMEIRRVKLFAMGSGGDYALGAMAAGKSAKQAVKIASRFDIHTGGDITVLTL